MCQGLCYMLFEVPAGSWIVPSVEISNQAGINNTDYDTWKFIKRPQAQALETWFHILVLPLD